MELTTYIESLKSSLQTTAAPAGKDVADAAALLAQAIEPAARLCPLEALSRAADEITLHLHNTTVEARLHGQEVDFVVSELDAIEAKEAQQHPWIRNQMTMSLGSLSGCRNISKTLSSKQPNPRTFP